jgi:hypothetical protein
MPFGGTRSVKFWSPKEEHFRPFFAPEKLPPSQSGRTVQKALMASHHYRGSRHLLASRRSPRRRT